MSAVRFVPSAMRIAPVALTLSLTLIPAPARAQDDTDAAYTVLGASHFLDAPAEVQRRKRREAKRTERWVFVAVGGNVVGYDSNIHESPDAVEASAVGGFGARVDAFRYFSDTARLKVSAEATGLQHTKTSSVSPYDQVGRMFYSYRPHDRVAFTTSARVRHSNDSETSIDGESYVRDYEYLSYLGSIGSWIYLNPDHKLRLTFSGHRRDYAETRGLRSLDWWKVGPRAAYHLEPTRDVDVELFYSYTFQAYDENRATTAAGRVFASNPTETHSFHRAGFESRWAPSDHFGVQVGYAYKTKLDRFESYETYAGHTVETAGWWSPSERWSVRAGARYRHRDFEHRPSSGTVPLVFDRWTASIGGSCRLWRRVSVFVDYSMDLRDSNRWAAENTYRDYARHVVLSGYSVTY